MTDIRRVGILFSGGPAPAANAVISSAAVSFLEHGHEVVGLFHGWSNLIPGAAPLVQDLHYRSLALDDVRGLRTSRGVELGTARADPASQVRDLEDLTDPERTAGLHHVHHRLRGLGLDALISIGGDGSLRSVHLYACWQQVAVPEDERIAVVHLPKTIDNDYHGIDFTFGFFTAVDVMAKEVENLRADAAATSSWFVVETMGRRAGWLSYGVAIAGEADLVLAVEDLDATLTVDGTDEGPLDLELLTARILDTVLSAEDRGKHHGVVVLAEGLAERLSDVEVGHQPGTEGHRHLSLHSLDLARLVGGGLAQAYEAATGHRKSFKGVQLGYESRCAPPHAFDVMLGSQLGIGAYRALVEEGLDRHMVSVSGQLELRYVPFSDLVDPKTGVTRPRSINRDGDLWRLARLLESRVVGNREWGPGRRQER